MYKSLYDKHSTWSTQVLICLLVLLASCSRNPEPINILPPATVSQHSVTFRPCRRDTVEWDSLRVSALVPWSDTKHIVAKLRNLSNDSIHFLKYTVSTVDHGNVSDVFAMQFDSLLLPNGYKSFKLDGQSYRFKDSNSINCVLVMYFVVGERWNIYKTKCKFYNTAAVPTAILLEMDD